MPSAYVLGAGRLASALVPGLLAAGWRVAGSARSARGRTRLRRLGAEPLPLERAAGFDVVLLAVPDSVIDEVVRGLVPHLTRGQVVAHGAGALTLDVLEPARRRGALPGSLHPLQALAGGPFQPGAAAAVDGGPAARRLLVRAARDLGLRPIRVPAAGRPLYHASAVMASNLVMALADLAAETWARAGAPPAEALPALVPLLRGAVENLAERGLPGALTGPASRGDAAVIRRQVRALRGEARDAYRVLTRRLVEIAARGGLDRARADAVLRAAGGAPRRPARRQPR
ncbi:NADP oxidoreductase coenzyme F420-dependent [Anaeromyxobacter dehalogenans 2CP-1]|uniref:NADP oxidoreductase coenzyme F420-dependent n=1 Tax=Anaeromyxobacter dehalogenans (strain ATCC BAA-258 / DSM 21875 / 2CP-1) TaxID=455488 RepID=B8J539_ANAD2|nr:Rossmann-like and DUF2520 domain-containing protein [Anaeromyxobacter dehalogenans]ACL64894.1 NADP oxidoreductase coenzyme F420-dependent [Anaeromyxobacter dehalogenans 2CP-1]